MRLIDADNFPHYNGYSYSALEIARAVEKAQNIDAVPVVHGHWIDGGVWDVCSVCGRAFLKVHLNGNPTFNYCPNCGAKMDEVSE